MKKNEKKYVITRNNGSIVSLLLQDGQLIQMDFESEQVRTASVGDIFIGKIKDIVPNIQAAFVEIANGQKCYLSLEKLQQPIFLNSKKNNIPHQGDEILVQVFREAIRTKPADLTVTLNITGRLVILTHGKNMIGVSAKIHDDNIRQHLQELAMPYKNQEYGFILRTNAAYASDEEILREFNKLIAEYQMVRQKAQYSTCFSMISKAPKHFIIDLRDMSDYQEIITDQRDIFEQVKEYLEKFQPENKEKLCFYQDSMISLWNLYGLQKKLERAIGKKVWLPCGGYLVIEPTEALTVIDVNSGKAVGKKKDKEAAYYKVNQEAAKEAAAQIRLRNLSGIILVDFIDMENNEDTESLISYFTEELHKDPIKTSFVDMTALHLAEITRKKVRKPLYQQIEHITEPLQNISEKEE